MSHKFMAAYLCVKCSKSLTWNEVMDSDGVCPYCGNLSNSTIVEHKKVSIKQELPPIYQGGLCGEAVD